MDNHVNGQQPPSPLIQYTDGAPDGTSAALSQRKYIAVLFGLIFAGFACIAVGSYLTNSATFVATIGDLFAPLLLGSFVLSIAGIIVMHFGRKNESVATTAVGYIMLIASFGFAIGFTLNLYDAGTIMVAMVNTCGITIIFGLLGFLFPQFFQKIGGILLGLLIAAILVQVVFFFMGVDPAWLDYVVILIFCGFIGHDVYLAFRAEPTYQNALFFAADLYLDIINIFIRILAIVGRK